jgi:hypothetical protein
MSIVALGMNVFLAVLLMAALVMGWRLERRLRGVRESHTVFAKAVAELDGATARAHAGLAELRAATDEAIDLLGGRLARAREAADRLDRSIASAETVLARPQPIERPPPVPVRQPALERPAVRREAAAPTDLRGLLDLVESARTANGFNPLRAPAVRTARPRTVDEELFDDAGAAR